MSGRLKEIKDKILPGNPVIQLSLEEIRWVVYQLEKAIEMANYYEQFVISQATDKAREFLEGLEK